VITQLATDGDWIIISVMCAISRNHHEREAWLKSGLIAFFMGKSWRSLKFWIKPGVSYVVAQHRAASELVNPLLASRFP